MIKCNYFLLALYLAVESRIFFTDSKMSWCYFKKLICVNIIKSLFKTYFAKGGCHLMVTVVDKGVLEDAVEHPENYPDLIVRVSGFSAVFVDLSPNIQQELLSRVLYDK
mgnify:CR=1 FL=1